MEVGDRREDEAKRQAEFKERSKRKGKRRRRDIVGTHCERSRAHDTTVDSGDRQSADGRVCDGPSHSSDLFF